MHAGLTVPKPTHGWRVLVIVAPLCSLGSLLLPWTRDGSTERNAYSLGRMLNEAGLITNLGERWLYDAVTVIPVIVGIVFAAMLLRRDGLAALLASISGVIELLASIAVIVKISEGVELGPWLAIALGAFTSASWPLWRTTKERYRV